jgi:hypothetical protein
VEAPFRFMITSLSDVEFLLSTLADAPFIALNSLRLTEGAELLEKRLSLEQRPSDRDLVAQAQTLTGIQSLLRALWNRPLTVQEPRFLRFDAKLLANPKVSLSLRIDVPTVESFQRWVDAEGSRDPSTQKQLLAAYHALSEVSHLRFVEI